ncbi:hypothetical protein BGZ54_008517 [Gamsiella multidivaricata]|nr:hypothetical protein BGZ54_008517 [Gamsiella multidivaricata]
MRVRVSSVILSLVVATLVIAAPAPHAARLEKRDEAEDKISDLLTKALESLGCDDCLAALVGVKEYAISDKSRVLEIVNNLCPTLSIWHVDEEYVPGTDAICNRPMCCRKYDDSPSNITRAAASWGDYSCDAPVKLGLDLLSYIPSVAKPSFSIMTGDVPPHDVWLEDRSAVLPIERHAYANMDNLGINIYPTVGNHESGPTNLYPTEASGGDLSWLYSSLADN